MAVAPKIIKVTVAPGRHLLHGVKPDEKLPYVEKAYRAGEMLDMPADEAARLRELGYLVDPDGRTKPANTAVPAVLGSDIAE